VDDDGVTAGWIEVLWSVATERGLDIDAPAAATQRALAEVAEAVEHAAGRLPDPTERRWLAAALAALSLCQPGGWAGQRVCGVA
jgi:hypothetical protein